MPGYWNSREMYVGKISGPFFSSILAILESSENSSPSFQSSGLEGRGQIGRLARALLPMKAKRPQAYLKILYF